MAPGARKYSAFHTFNKRPRGRLPELRISRRLIASAFVRTDFFIIVGGAMSKDSLLLVDFDEPTLVNQVSNDRRCCNKG